AAPGDALAFLQVDFAGPALDLRLVHDTQGLSLAIDATIELARLAQRHRLLACGRDFNLAIDEADDLVPLSRTAPEVGAANAGGHLCGADCDFALARLRHHIGSEAKGALQHIERRLEELAR